jgi:hypothetical protein
MSDPYTGDATFEATPVVSRFPPPTRPPSLNQQGDRHQFSNKREAPSPSMSVEESRQKRKIHRTLSSPKMAIQNLLHSSGSLYRSCVDIPPANTSVNWCECTRAQRVDTLSPGKDLVLRLAQVRRLTKSFRRVTGKKTQLIFPIA